jgi:hypothetical protein
MANVGELFKVLGNNEIFNSYCQDKTKSNDNVLNESFNNEELMTILRSIVNDDNVIKSKMEVIIGQKRKNANKQKTNNVTTISSTNETVSASTRVEEEKEIEETKPKFAFEPINQDNVIYLNDHSYLERVGIQMRLVTVDYELFY